MEMSLNEASSHTFEGLLLSLLSFLHVNPAHVCVRSGAGAGTDAVLLTLHRVIPCNGITSAARNCKNSAKRGTQYLAGLVDGLDEASRLLTGHGVMSMY